MIIYACQILNKQPDEVKIINEETAPHSLLLNWESCGTVSLLTFDDFSEVMMSRTRINKGFAESGQASNYLTF